MSGHRLSLRCKVLVASALVILAGAARADERVAGTQSDVVVQALSLLGTPYRFGGGSPQTGFDCSGLVRHVFGPVLGWELPRRSEEMRAVGLLNEITTEQGVYTRAAEVARTLLEHAPLTLRAATEHTPPVPQSFIHSS